MCLLSSMLQIASYFAQPALGQRVPAIIHARRLHEATKQLLTQLLRLRRVRPPENSAEGLSDTKWPNGKPEFVSGRP